MKNIIIGLIIGWVSFGVYHFFHLKNDKNEKVNNTSKEIQEMDNENKNIQKLILTNSIKKEDAKQYVCNYLSKRKGISNNREENTFFFKMGFDELNTLISYWDDPSIINDSLKLYLMIYPNTLDGKTHPKSNMINLILVRTVGLHDQLDEKDEKEDFFTFGSIQNQVGQCPPPANCYVDRTSLLGETLYEMNEYPGQRLPPGTRRRMPTNQ